ncbi:MAG: extracellular solute-binding protein family 1 [Verrucomicrobiales bacterium]|nr:extracellular solute-binding protein family 1 [Verrucomicrobiales bacterium]
MKSKLKPTAPASRRHFFRSLALGSLIGLLCGCGESGKPSGSSASASAETSASGDPDPANDKIVTIYTWDMYLNPELLTEFQKRTGLEVQPLIYESSDEMVDGLKSEPGRYDLFICEDGYIPIVAGKRLMKEVDKKKLPHYKNLDPKFLDQPFDPENQFTVPYLWGTTLLAYRKDLLPNPSHSWNIIFDPALKNRISFLDDRMEGYAGVLRTMGINLPDADVTSIKKAAETMVDLVRNNGMRLGGGNEVKQHLLDGISAVSMIYSGDAALIAKENPTVPIGYFIPDEGATVWTDSFCISRDTTRLANAYKFLDFMIEAKSAAASANFLSYASPNKAAVEFINPELLADETINPRQEVLDKCRYFQLRDVDSARMVNDGWRRVQEAWMERSGQALNSLEKQTASTPDGEPPAADAPAAAPEGKIDTAPN